MPIWSFELWVMSAWDAFQYYWCHLVLDLLRVPCRAIFYWIWSSVVQTLQDWICLHIDRFKHASRLHTLLRGDVRIEFQPLQLLHVWYIPDCRIFSNLSYVQSREVLGKRGFIDLYYLSWRNLPEQIRS